MPGLVYMPGVCRCCGCTNEKPCPGGCSWTEPDLCSACVDDEYGDVLDLLEEQEQEQDW